MTSSHLLLVSSHDLAPQSPEPELRVYRGSEQVGVFVLKAPGLTVGKAPTNDVVIEAAHVSKRHMRILSQRGKWALEDLGSTNGLFVYEGDQLVYSSTIDPEPWPLRDRQEIRLGPHPGEWRLIFSDPTATAASPAIYLDERLRQVWVRGRLVRVPRDPYIVLLQLYREAPVPCSYEVLCAALEEDRQARQRIAGSPVLEPSLDSLHQLIHRLRARVERDPKKPTLILQVPQFGYRLRKEG